MLANEIGCLPTREWLLMRPKLAFKVLCGPMTSYHYRLMGQSSGCGGSNKSELATDIILNRLPIGTRSRDLLFYAGIHISSALLIPTWRVLKLLCGLFGQTVLWFIAVVRHSSFFLSSNYQHTTRKQKRSSLLPRSQSCSSLLDLASSNSTQHVKLM